MDELINSIKKYWYYNNKIDLNKLYDVNNPFILFDKFLKPIDKHAFIEKISDSIEWQQEIFNNYEKYLPITKLTYQELTIILPDFPGILTKNYGSLYANIINESLYQAYQTDIRTVIIDLSKNMGGNQVVMITGLQSLLPDNQTLYFEKNNKNEITRKINLNNGKLEFPLYDFEKDYINKNQIPIIKVKRYFKFNPDRIIIKVSNNTCSAGEITAVCFINQKNVEIIGQPSCGSCEQTYSNQLNNYFYMFTSFMIYDNANKQVKQIIPANYRNLIK